MATARPGAALAQAVASRDANSIRQLMSQWGGVLRRDGGQVDKDAAGFMDDFMQAGGVKLLLKELDESCSASAAGSTAGSPRAASSRPSPTKAKAKAASKPTSKLDKAIADLEEKKQAALAAEDFALAGRLKEELEELKAAGGRAPSAGSASSSQRPKDPLDASSALLAESLRDDDRLVALVEAADQRALRAELLRVVVGAVGSPPPAGFELKPSLVEFHAEEVADAVADAVSALGDGAGLVAAVKSLADAAGAQDWRMARFVSRLKTVAVAAGKDKGKGLADAETKSLLKALDGYWLDGTGVTSTVQDGKATIGGKAKMSVTVKNGQMCLDGMTSSAFSSKRVDWAKGGEVVTTWARLSKEEYDQLLKEVADREAEQKRAKAEAKAEAERVKAEAKAEADRAKAEAKAEAERAKAEAKAEAERAKAQAGRAKADAERRAKEEVAEKKRQEEEAEKGRKAAETRAKEAAAATALRQKQLEEEERRAAAERRGDPLSTACALVYEALMEQDRLKSLAMSTNKPEVLDAIRQVLLQVYDGDAWPAPFTLTRNSFPPATLLAVARVVEENSRGSVPLGENVLICAIRDLNKPSGFAPCVVQLFKEIRTRALEDTTPGVQKLVGVWKTSTGALVTVCDGKVTFAAGQLFSISDASHEIVLNGWTAKEVQEGKLVRWQKDGKKVMQWERVDRLSDIEALHGLWKNPEGLVCQVTESRCTFVDKDWDLQLSMSRGLVNMNGWVAMSITETSLKWQKSGQVTEWKRVQNVSDITALEGSWTNTDGLQCEVSKGKCTFSGKAKSAYPMAMQGGFIVLNGWRAVKVTTAAIAWEKDGKSMEWRRSNAALAPALPVQQVSAAKTAPGAGRDELTPDKDRGVGVVEERGEKVVAQTEAAGKVKDAPTGLSKWGLPVGSSPEDVISEPDSEPLSNEEEGGRRQGKDSLSRATGSLLDMLQADRRFASITGSSTVHDLERHLRRLLVRSLGGTPWPTTYPKRALLKACFVDVVETVADVIRTPQRLSLDDDALGALFRSLERQPFVRDERWLRFQARMQELAHHAHVAGANRPPRLQSLNGLWKTSDGLTCAVRDGDCTFFTKSVVRIAQAEGKDGKLSINGWEVATFSETSVLWQRGSRTMQWDRITNAKDLDILDGEWGSSDGVACTVTRGMCSFHNVGSTFPVNLKESWIVLNGWRASTITSTSILWEKGGRVMEWRRLDDAADEAPKGRPETPRKRQPETPMPPPGEVQQCLDAARGVWKSTTDEGLVTFMDGIATPLNGIASAIEAQGDSLTWNGWQAAFKNVSKSTIQWTKGSDVMVWRRFDDASSIEALAGRWKNTEGLVCAVAAGVCGFVGKNAFVHLKLEDGAVSLNGWVAQAILSDRVVWRKGDGRLEWHRLPVGQDAAASKAHFAESTAPLAPPKAPPAGTLPVVAAKQLDGIWLGADGKIFVSLDGVCAWESGATSSIRIDGGVASMDDCKATAVSETAVKWDGPGKSIEWTRVLRAQDVEVLRGFWKNTEGLVCFVAEGDCSFISKGRAVKLTIADGALSLNEWRATSISDAQVSWRRGTQLLQWHRVSDPAALESLAGTWNSSEGGSVRIAGGVATFDNKRSAPFSIADGALVMNGWAAVILTPTLLSWRKAGKQLEWSKAPSKSAARDRTSSEGGSAAADAAASAQMLPPNAQTLPQDAPIVQQTPPAEAPCFRDALSADEQRPAQNAPPQPPLHQQKQAEPRQKPQHPSSQQEQNQSANPQPEQQSQPQLQPQLQPALTQSQRQQQPPAQQQQLKPQEQDQLRQLPQHAFTQQTAPTSPQTPSPTANKEGVVVTKTSLDVDKLTGIWVNSEGLLCTVYEGMCTFIAAGAYKVEVTQDGLLLNKWRAVSMQPDEIVWERDGQTTRWFRLQHPTEVEDINGRWKNSDGLLCQVSRGMCVFSGHPPIGLQMQGGLVSLNAWRTTAILDKQIIWQGSGRTMVWDRVSYPTA